jgi:hypothetical protein
MRRLRVESHGGIDKEHGLNDEHNHDLEHVMKAAGRKPEEKGMQAEISMLIN